MHVLVRSHVYHVTPRSHILCLAEATSKAKDRQSENQRDDETDASQE